MIAPPRLAEIESILLIPSCRRRALLLFVHAARVELLLAGIELLLALTELLLPRLDRRFLLAEILRRLPPCK